MLSGSPPKVAPAAARATAATSPTSEPDSTFKTADQKAKERQKQQFLEKFAKIRKEEEEFAKELEKKGEQKVLGASADVDELRHSMFENTVILTKIDALTKQGGKEDEVQQEMQNYIDSVRTLREARQRGEAKSKRDAASDLSAMLDVRTSKSVGFAPNSALSPDQASTSSASPNTGRAAARAGPPPRVSAAEAKKRSSADGKKQSWARASEIDRGGARRRSSLSGKLESLIRGGRSMLPAKLGGLTEDDEDGIDNEGEAKVTIVPPKGSSGGRRPSQGFLSFMRGSGKKK